MAIKITKFLYITILLILFSKCMIIGPEGFLPKLTLWLFIASGFLIIIKSVFESTRRGFLWLCFILLFYFIFAVVSLFASNDNTIYVVLIHNWLLLTMIVLCFISSIIASRSS
jgi:uncharacterized membrane protein